MEAEQCLFKAAAFSRWRTGARGSDPGAADRADGADVGGGFSASDLKGVFLKNIQEYSLLIQPVRLNYQSWISVPIGQSVARGHAPLSNRISLLLQGFLSKLRAQGCYIKEATIRRESSSPPQGLWLWVGGGGEDASERAR